MDAFSRDWTGLYLITQTHSIQDTLRSVDVLVQRCILILSHENTNIVRDNAQKGDVNQIKRKGAVF